MNIVLTGMRGSGKSYHGRKLANVLGWKFLDTDDLIVKKTGEKIPEIVQKHGWKHFRKLETSVSSEIADLDEHIISTGGGLIINRENEQLLRKNGKIIFLYRSPENCAKHIVGGHKHKDRPALTDRNIEDPAQLQEELEEIWQEREKRYRESADLIVDANEEVELKKVLEKLQDL
jgi:shikimate kinase